MGRRGESVRKVIPMGEDGVILDDKVKPGVEAPPFSNFFLNPPILKSKLTFPSDWETRKVRRY